MPNSTIETSPVETQPNAEAFESLDLLVDQQPHTDVPVGQVVIAQEVVTAHVPTIEQYIETLAKQAAVECHTNEVAVSSSEVPDQTEVDFKYNQWYNAGFNATRFDTRLEDLFLETYNSHYFSLKNPEV